MASPADGMFPSPVEGLGPGFVGAVYRTRTPGALPEPAGACRAKPFPAKRCTVIMRAARSAPVMDPAMACRRSSASLLRVMRFVREDRRGFTRLGV